VDLQTRPAKVRTDLISNLQRVNLLDCVSDESLAWRGEDGAENACGFFNDGVQLLSVEKF